MKSKVAIAIDEALLKRIDSLIGKSGITSRSHAIDLLLRKGLAKESVDTAIMLIHGNNLDCLFQPVDGGNLIGAQISFLIKNGVRKLFVVTKTSEEMAKKIEALGSQELKIKVVLEQEPTGTASALALLKSKVKNNFIVLNADTLNQFDLIRMIDAHTRENRIITMGLIHSDDPGEYGSVALDGNAISKFSEKQIPESNVINAGIYIMKPSVFDLYDSDTKSLEFDLFPKLAQIKQIHGYFTQGKYIHVSEN